MKSFSIPSYKLKLFLCVLFASLLNRQTAQAQATVTSTAGYTVTIDVKPISLVNKVCGGGSFSYDLQAHYTISFNPATAPDLYALEGTYLCNNVGSFFLLPTVAGSGNVTANTATYYGSVNCSTATPSDISCSNYVIRIHGVGIADQYINVTGSALPLKLVSFDARKQDNGIFLTWSTVSESGSKELAVERSSDAVNWQAIHAISSVDANGHQYQYTDAEPATGTGYYRIRQTDKDGSSTYSRIIGVKSATDAEISVYPNPSNGDIMSFAGLESNAGWTFNLSNTLGQGLLKAQPVQEKISLAGIPAGVYFIRLNNSISGESHVIRFIKN